MILTGTEIVKERSQGRICIEPFNDTQVNPNSYNYRLGTHIKKFVTFEQGKSIFIEESIPAEGVVLEPGQVYLACTQEVIGSTTYAMSLIGRSSLGRLGLFLQVSANLGHVGSCHQWTLELVASVPIRLYPGMVIGQVSFWVNTGESYSYTGVYGTLSGVQESLREE